MGWNVLGGGESVSHNFQRFSNFSDFPRCHRDSVELYDCKQKINKIYFHSQSQQQRDVLKPFN